MLEEYRSDNRRENRNRKNTYWVWVKQAGSHDVRVGQQGRHSRRQVWGCFSCLDEAANNQIILEWFNPDTSLRYWKRCWPCLYRAETSPRVTRVTQIQKIRGKLCASKNRFVHLLGVHWFFGSRKYMPHHTTQQCPGVPSPSAVITAPCDAPLDHWLIDYL